MPTDEIKTKQIVLVDDNDTPRGMIGTLAEGGPVELALFASNGMTAAIQLHEDGNGSVRIGGTNGMPGISLATGEFGAGLTVYGKEGKPAIILGVDQRGDAFIKLLRNGEYVSVA